MRQRTWDMLDDARSAIRMVRITRGGTKADQLLITGRLTGIDGVKNLKGACARASDLKNVTTREDLADCHPLACMCADEHMAAPP
jgi:hypothetical protein